jgi:hypothetical protein
MPVNKVDLTVSQLINDLNTGLTWFKKDDLGYGSIEVKYGANPAQIMAIRKHPALKDAETNITVFNVIDDTKNERTTTVSSNGSESSADLANVSKNDQKISRTPESVSTVSQRNNGAALTSVTADADDLSAFVNL